MDLWIRSQDKERLGKIVYLELKKDDYGFYLIGWRDKFEGTRMATYKTKERALEVLDEIQKYIEKQGTNEILVNDNGIPNGSIYYGKVYEMPKEWL